MICDFDPRAPFRILLVLMARPVRRIFMITYYSTYGMYVYIPYYYRSPDTTKKMASVLVFLQMREGKMVLCSDTGKAPNG